MSDHNINASKFLDAILALQEKDVFNDFVQHIARVSPGRFIKLAEDFTTGNTPKYRVMMTDLGLQKIRAIKFVRSILKDGLAETKHYVENPSDDQQPLFVGTQQECKDWIHAVKVDGVRHNFADGTYVHNEYPLGMILKVVPN